MLFLSYFVLYLSIVCIVVVSCTKKFI